MNKLLSRKFWLLAITYIVFITFFAIGKLPVNWFCLSMLGMTAFYYIANVLQKQLENLTIDQIIEIVDSYLDRK